MYLLGIDVGTTGTKSIVADETGAVLGYAYQGYPLVTGSGNAVEQDPDAWWDACCSTVRQCLRQVPDAFAIGAISLSAQGGSTVAVDDTGRPLRPAFSWMDHRDPDGQQELTALHPADYYYETCGWKPDQGFSLSHIRWMRTHEPRLFQRASCFADTLAYLNYRLTGRFVTDYTCAGISELCNVTSGDWEPELLSILGIQADRLPEIRPAGVPVGTLTPQAAEALGLSRSVVVVNGAHDQYCAALSSGVIAPGQILLSTGTAWAVFGAFSRLLFDRDSYIAPCRHIPENTFGAILTTASGGVALEWFKDKLALPSDSFAHIDAQAADRGLKCRHLFFYPYFSGTHYPLWNPAAKGVVFGLGLEHDRYDIALAVMESVAMEQAILLETFQKHGCAIQSLKMSGGAAKSALWTQLVCDILGHTVIRLENSESACMGAIVLAARGSGRIAGYEEGCRRFGPRETTVFPDPGRHALYREKLAEYREIACTIIPLFH